MSIKKEKTSFKSLLLQSVVGLFLLFSTGCLKSHMTLFVNEDGSGTVQIDTYAIPCPEEKLLAGMLSKGRSFDTRTQLKDQNLWKNMAPQMGKGVTFSGTTPIQKNGKEGIRATYTYTHINRLVIGPAMAATPLQKMNLVPLDVSYRFFLNQQKPQTLKLFPPPNRTNPHANSMNEVLGEARHVFGFQPLLKRMLRHVTLTMDLQLPSPILESNVRKHMDAPQGHVQLVQIDLEDIIAYGDLDALMEVKDMPGIIRLHQKNLPGFQIQDPATTLHFTF